MSFAKLLILLITIFGLIGALLILMWLLFFRGPSAVADASPTPTALTSATPSLEITLAPGATATPAPEATPTVTLTPGETATPTPKATKTPKPTRTPKPTDGATATPTPAPTQQPTPAPTEPLTLNGGNEATWTSKQKRDQPDPAPSPLLDTAYSTLEIRFKVSQGQVTQMEANRDSGREVDVDVNSNESGVLANGRIKIVVTLTNGGNARGAFVFTVKEINGETLKGTYEFTSTNGTVETGSFTMTHT